MSITISRTKIHPLIISFPQYESTSLPSKPHSLPLRLFLFYPAKGTCADKTTRGSTASGGLESLSRTSDEHPKHRYRFSSFVCVWMVAKFINSFFSVSLNIQSFGLLRHSWQEPFKNFFLNIFTIRILETIQVAERVKWKKKVRNVIGRWRLSGTSHLSVLSIYPEKKLFDSETFLIFQVSLTYTTPNTLSKRSELAVFHFCRSLAPTIIFVT